MKFHFSKEFSPYPYGRYKTNGKFSGEALREILLEKFQEAQDKNEPLEIILDDAHGLSGAFIDEAFGKLSKMLKEQGKFLSEKNIRFSGDLPHYRIYIGKIWENINKHYEVESEHHTA